MRTARLASAVLLTSLFTVIASPTAQAADPNSAAIAVNDHYYVTAGQTLTVDAPGVLANDSDPDGDPIHVGGVNKQFDHAESGTGGIFGDGSFTYTPEPGFIGDDTAIYKAYDEEPFPSAEATITVTVRAANTAPTAVDDHYYVAAGQTLTVDAPGVLSNDSDPDGDNLSIASYPTDFSHAADFSFGAHGSFTYTPALGFTGDDTVTYIAQDENLARSAPATLTISVVDAAAVNSAPVAVADHYTVTQGETLSISAPGLLANDSDVDGDTMHVGYDPTSFSHATSFDFGYDGSLTYTPEPGFTGDDTGTYGPTTTISRSATSPTSRSRCCRQTTRPPTRTRTRTLQTQRRCLTPAAPFPR